MANFVMHGWLGADAPTVDGIPTVETTGPVGGEGFTPISHTTCVVVVLEVKCENAKIAK